MTVTEYIEYIRSYSKALKDSNLPRGLVVKFLNQGKNKLQRDVMALGIKEFRRMSYLSGSIVSLPSDIMEVPDSIVDVLTSIGTVRPAIDCVFTGANNNILVTARQPGTPNNNTTISFVDGLASGVTITVVFTTKDQWSIIVEFVPAATASSLITAINNHPIASKLIIPTSSEGTGLGGITLGVGTVFTLIGGVGTGFYPADEWNTDDFNRNQDISLLNPDYKNPKYTVTGSFTTSKYKVINLLPITITYSLIEYYYSIGDVSLDADSFIGLPSSYYEDLILLDALHNSYQILYRDAEDDKKKIEYLKEVQSLDEKYKSKLGMKGVEKDRVNRE